MTAAPVDPKWNWCGHSVHNSSKMELMTILSIVQPKGTNGHSVHSSSKMELVQSWRFN